MSRDEGPFADNTTQWPYCKITKVLPVSLFRFRFQEAHVGYRRYFNLLSQAGGI